MVLERGRVTFTVPHEFKVTLTMLSEALDFPWRIISVEFLVSDPEKNISGPLIHPRQTRFLVQQAQSRILYQSFDKRPPLVHLYDMLHAFATSLQLDVLYEQAQRLRSRRPTDPFNIECYRPGQLLKVIYWRGLTNCNYQAVMGPDGKMRPAVYSISIHVDPLDPQRPLSLTHHPELSAIDVHKIGSFVRGDCLSIENLLTRTIIIRAEAILMDIKRELLPLSPGPIVTSEIPLCLSVPILWPCYTHELLYLRVDSAQGHLRASFATESIKGPQLLRELEMAFNRPSCRRVNFDHGSATDYRAGTRGMRSLAGDDARWQARLVDIFARLRCLLGQWRISSVHHNRPVRDSLPIAVPTDKSLDLPYTELLERAQQGRVALSYIKLFPNDDHYLVCEITPTPSLSVDYQYYMMKCVSMPVTVTDFHVPSGGRWLTYNPNHVADSSGAVSSPSVVLRITHFLPFNGNVLAPSIKSTFSCRQQQQPPAKIRKRRLLGLRGRRQPVVELLVPFHTAWTHSLWKRGAVSPHDGLFVALDARTMLVSAACAGCVGGKWDEAVFTCDSRTFRVTPRRRNEKSRFILIREEQERRSQTPSVRHAVKGVSHRGIVRANVRLKCSLQEGAVQSQHGRMRQRLKRVRVLLDHLPEGASDVKRRCLERLDPRARAMVESFDVSRESQSSDADFEPLPDLLRLLSDLEDDVIASELTFKLTENGIVHDGVNNNAQSGILTVDVRSIPTSRLPTWAQAGCESLRQHTKRVLLISSTKAYASSPTAAAAMRSWRLNIAFSGLPGERCTNGGNLLYQSEEVHVNSTAELAAFVALVVREWESLCRMFAICEPVLRNPACLPRDVSLKAFDAKSLVLAYGPGKHYLAELSIDSRHQCVLRLGVHPGPSTVKRQQDDSPEELLKRDLFENPHCIIREHLEYLLNGHKSVSRLCNTLSSTLPFVVAMEVVRKPTVMTNPNKVLQALFDFKMLPSCQSVKVQISVFLNTPPQSSSVAASARPLRSMALIALSCFDLALVYRGTLCMRFRLEQKVTPGGATADVVHISDGCQNHGQPVRPGGISSEIYPVQGFVQLPAFQQFLASIQRTLRAESEGEDSLGCVSVPQLAQLLTPGRGSPSPLECYLSASLIFHASFQAVNTLRWQVPSAPVAQAGEFASKVPDSGLEVRLKLHAEEPSKPEGFLPRWRLGLMVTPDPLTCPAERSAELSGRIGEFFQRRVCNLSPQAAAITSFFRLLSLPAATLHDLVSNVFAWDLEGGSSAPNSPFIRVCLVSVSSPHFPEPAVVLRAPTTLSMQLIVSSRPPQHHHDQSSVGSRSPSTEMIWLTYDWSKNHVAFVPGSASKRLQNYDDFINQRFMATRACTLVQLISHIRQMPPLSSDVAPVASVVMRVPAGPGTTLPQHSMQ
ncbi:unnamed protein product [Mesocestoides corti]|uniref:Mediator of RNA polymerase II transcription subunit 14 n=1 Tax=Mesocestoides corti TaxID=53468 RepID=A0A158QSJ2_MESCO|nr:unnamed protein product [Mesocestoides corti]